MIQKQHSKIEISQDLNFIAILHSKIFTLICFVILYEFATISFSKLVNTSNYSIQRILLKLKC